jgi:hypothetical protein
MAPKKLNKELGAIQEEDNVAIVPTESLPKQVLEMKENKLVSKVKREMTPAQKINMAKMIEANKVRFENMRKAKEDAIVAAEKARKDDIQAKLDAGTHVRVKIIPKTKRVKKEVDGLRPNQSKAEAPPVSEEESEESSVEYQASSKPAKVKKVRPPTPVDTTATDTETDGETYKQGKRNVRREVKKNLKALKEIDNVISSNGSNPYLSYLTGKWK